MPCGCDPGCGEAGYLCERHRSTLEPMTLKDMPVVVDPTMPRNRIELRPMAAAFPYIWPIDTPQGRKQRPLVTGVLDYFPDALLEVALCSYVGNEQHNPGMALHWDRSKSTDEVDAQGRHLLTRGTVDTDGVRHSAKVAWRALAALQKEIEAERAAG